MRIIIEIEDGRVTSTTVDGIPLDKSGDAATEASLMPPPDLLRRAAALGAASAGPATLRPEAGSSLDIVPVAASPASSPAYTPAARPRAGDGENRAATTAADAGRAAIESGGGAEKKSGQRSASSIRRGGKGKGRGTPR